MQAIPSITLLGHNGAGKTTLLHYLMGFFPHNKAHPFLDGFSKKISPLHEKKIAYAPERSLLVSSLSAWHYFHQCGVYDINKIEALLREVSLNVDIKMPIAKYSKGMQQRLQLALAFAREPEILLLDEPTSGLDPFGTEAMHQLLLEKSKTLTIVLSTHDIDFAYLLQNQIWILKEGEIIYQNIPDSLHDLKAIFKKSKPEVLR